MTSPAKPGCVAVSPTCCIVEISPYVSRLQAELLDAVAHLIAVDAEQLGRLALVSAGALERLHQQLAFDLFEVDALRRQSKLCRLNGPRQRREVRRLERIVDR